jgi:hypothetical protein
MSVEPYSNDDSDFSFELRVEVSRALSAYLANGDAARERLHTATGRVCTEAHALKMSPEQVVTALRRLFERTPLAGDGEPARRHAAWEEFTRSCIAAYYNAGEVD